MATMSQWVEGARIRTFPAAVSPVLVGTGAAAALDNFVAWRAILALLVSLALQVGVNYANDYSDGIRGTDADRVGPFRLVGSGSAAPKSVKRAAFLAFGVALVAGLVLVVATQAWWLFAVGAACVVAAWYYTGGRKPYGYAGLGEVFVFVFFGLVATLGTTFVQALTISWAAVAAAVAIGCYTCAILVANNVRDIPGDIAVGKRTLAVRMGDPASRWFWTVLISVAHLLAVVLAVFFPWTLLSLAALVFAIPAARHLLRGAKGRDLIPTLRDTGLAELVFALGLALGLAL